MGTCTKRRPYLSIHVFCSVFLVLRLSPATAVLVRLRLGVTLQLFNQLFSRIENSARLGPASKTPLRLFVVLQRALFAKVVVATGDDGVLEPRTADDALEGEVVLVAALDLVTLRVVVVRTVPPFLELAFDLPAVLVVGAVVEELAAVSETAEPSFLE